MRIIQMDNKMPPRLRKIPVNRWKIEKTAVSTFLWIERCGDKGRFNDILYIKTETLYLLSIFFLQKFKKNPESKELKGDFSNVYKSGYVVLILSILSTLLVWISIWKVMLLNG